MDRDVDGCEERKWWRLADPLPCAGHGSRRVCARCCRAGSLATGSLRCCDVAAGRMAECAFLRLSAGARLPVCRARPPHAASGVNVHAHACACVCVCVRARVCACVCACVVCACACDRRQTLTRACARLVPKSPSVLPPCVLCVHAPPTHAQRHTKGSIARTDAPTPLCRTLSLTFVYDGIACASAWLCMGFSRHVSVHARVSRAREHRFYHTSTKLELFVDMHTYTRVHTHICIHTYAYTCTGFITPVQNSLKTGAVCGHVSGWGQALVPKVQVEAPRLPLSWFVSASLCVCVSVSLSGCETNQ